MKDVSVSNLSVSPLFFTFILLAYLQEQNGNDESDMQMMRAHTETLLETLRDIAQVHRTCFYGRQLDFPSDGFIFVSSHRQFCQTGSRHRKRIRTTLPPCFWR